jgi:hypothetical protein
MVLPQPRRMPPAQPGVRIAGKPVTTATHRAPGFSGVADPPQLSTVVQNALQFGSMVIHKTQILVFETKKARRCGSAIGVIPETRISNTCYTGQPLKATF